MKLYSVKIINKDGEVEYKAIKAKDPDFAEKKTEKLKLNVISIEEMGV